MSRAMRAGGIWPSLAKRGKLLCVLCCVWGIGTLPVSAQDVGRTSVTKHEPTKNNEPTQPRIEITEQQQQIVQDFVRANHPELDLLLAYLKEHQPQEYKRAIRDLYRNVSRIESWRDRDPERYQLELRLWQLESKSQLVAARLTMLDEQQRQDELRELLRQQMALRIELLQRERERVAERLAKLDQQISELQANQEQLVARQLQTLLRAMQDAKPQRPAAKSAAGPAPARQNEPKKNQPPRLPNSRNEKNKPSTDVQP
ncbi:MAG: hypothetical protein KatS3mg110_1871 [Pirellulaceae bacterium]|nr:MAG: hypothetical protein KatS3mg110_1871 [Pirellulaceae bacterium]